MPERSAAACLAVEVLAYDQHKGTANRPQRATGVYLLYRRFASALQIGQGSRGSPAWGGLPSGLSFQGIQWRPLPSHHSRRAARRAGAFSTNGSEQQSLYIEIIKRKALCDCSGASSLSVGLRPVLQRLLLLPAPPSPRQRRARPASLITGQAFNGGLRYDEDLSAISAKTFVKQRIARVEDANRKSRPGTLPFFTVIGLDTSAPDLARTATELVLAYLTSVVGLDPARLRATTTMRSSTFFPILANHGIAAAQVRLRPWDEAVKDGLGSGYYAPVGHPSNPGATSFSLEYVMPSGLDLEIAEITHSDGNGRSGGGIGVERVEMARTGQFPAWKSTLDALSQALQDEAQHTGASLPPGLAALTRSATPSL